MKPVLVNYVWSALTMRPHHVQIVLIVSTRLLWMLYFKMKYALVLQTLPKLLTKEALVLSVSVIPTFTRTLLNVKPVLVNYVWSALTVGLHHVQIVLIVSTTILWTLYFKMDNAPVLQTLPKLLTKEALVLSVSVTRTI